MFPDSPILPRSLAVRGIGRTVLASADVSPIGFQIAPAQLGVGSACRLLRLNPELCRLMRTELPGAHFSHVSYIVLIYMAIPFWRNESPGNVAIFGDAISPHSRQICYGGPIGFYRYLLNVRFMRMMGFCSIFSILSDNEKTPSFWNISPWACTNRRIEIPKLYEDGDGGPMHNMLDFCGGHFIPTELSSI